MSENSYKLHVSVLLAGEYQQDRLLVYDVFRRLGWRLFEARDRSRAVECLARNSVHVVIAETQTPNWSWKQALQDLRQMSPEPQLVVASRTADDHLWAEVLNVGGYDVLPQPFQRDELERVVAGARRHFDPKPARAGRVAVAGAA